MLQMLTYIAYHSSRDLNQRLSVVLKIQAFKLRSSMKWPFFPIFNFDLLQKLATLQSQEISLIFEI